MATIRKRSGNWQALVRRLGQKTLSQTFPTKAEAVTWARAKETEIDVAERPVEVIELATTTLADLIVRYRDTVTPTKKSAYQERYRLNRLLREPVVNLTLDKLTTGAFAKFRDDRLKTVGPQQVRHDLNAFAVVLRTARLDWDVPLKSIPVDAVRKPKMPRGRDRRLLDGEYERLRYAVLSGEPPYLWAVVEFALQSGMRQAEILRLRWQDISFEARIAHLSDTKKGDPRDVPLTTRAMVILRQQRDAGYLGRRTEEFVYSGGDQLPAFHQECLVAGDVQQRRIIGNCLRHHRMLVLLDQRGQVLGGCLVADGAVEACGAQPIIPQRSQMKRSRDFDARIYKKRNLVERAINKLKHFRRIATRYDRKPANFMAFLCLATLPVWLPLNVESA